MRLVHSLFVQQVTECVAIQFSCRQRPNNRAAPERIGEISLVSKVICVR